MKQRLIGACKEPASFDIDIDSLTLQDGCTMWLEADGPDSYVGGTESKNCKANSGGAVYTTTAMIIEPLTITAWERGWDANNVQVWGSDDGPYSYERIN